MLKHGLSRTARNVRSLMEKYFALRRVVLRANNWRTPAKGRYISLRLLGRSSRGRCLFVVGKKCATGRIDRSRYEASRVAGIWNFFSSAGFLAGIYIDRFILYRRKRCRGSWNFKRTAKSVSRFFFFFLSSFSRGTLDLRTFMACRSKGKHRSRRCNFRAYSLRASFFRRRKTSLTWRAACSINFLLVEHNFLNRWSFRGKTRREEKVSASSTSFH